MSLAIVLLFFLLTVSLTYASVRVISWSHRRTFNYHANKRVNLLEGMPQSSEKVESTPDEELKKELSRLEDIVNKQGKLLMTIGSTGNSRSTLVEMADDSDKAAAAEPADFAGVS